MIGMKPGCKRGPGGSEPKKRKATHQAEGRSGLVGKQQQQKATWKKKQAVSKESERGNLLSERARTVCQKKN